MTSDDQTVSPDGEAAGEVCTTVHISEADRVVRASTRFGVNVRLAVRPLLARLTPREGRGG